MSNSTQTLNKVYLKDYKKPDYTIDTVNLTVALEESATQVLSVMKIKKQNLAAGALILNGEHLVFKSLKLDGRELSKEHYILTEKYLEISNLPTDFILEIENVIDPKGNTALEGLYLSGNMYCTQNEPEGFRRITYFLDRPDVMAIYTTKIIGDKTKTPILLSNGNPTSKGDLPGNKHYVEWQDPFRKPSYLFALVAGDLGMVQDHFTTASGKKVTLQIFCDKGNEKKCSFAMESLKRAMKWDEERFGLEYDLDIFMIVAVDAFNFGAMENKGLNVFNSKYVLADVATATDDRFYDLEGIIGHEYFHNWTGNRVTCRDWFQLTLKEGLTVFRDQEFSADLNSRVVNRIKNVSGLRSAQFPEDAGPMAHPIKPDSFIEINNFYTSTVYEKGAEVIRMIQTLLGVDGFRKGIDKYFELYDGQAVTTEDFLHAMSVANNDYDFSDFKRWYSQAGTPVVKLKHHYEENSRTMTIELDQSCPTTPGQPTKLPFVIPLQFGIVTPTGKDQMSELIVLKEAKSTLSFKNIDKGSVPSINRNFSAPIYIETDLSLDEKLHLMAKESDFYTRYEMAQNLSKTVIQNKIKVSSTQTPLKYIEAFKAILCDPKVDNLLKAELLSFPSQNELHAEQQPILIQATFDKVIELKTELATAHKSEFLEIYQELVSKERPEWNGVNMGNRSLKITLLSYLMKIKGGEYDKLAFELFTRADNMSDKFGALSLLVVNETPFTEQALASFFEEWQHDTLVIQTWLSVQASSLPVNALERVKQLEQNKVYDKGVPNLFRSLVGAFASNLKSFHALDGSGYAFIADKIIEMDKINPNMASRLATAFKYFNKLPSTQNEAMRESLEKIRGVKELSPNTFEIIKAYF